jgi:hypothetical protein
VGAPLMTLAVLNVCDTPEARTGQLAPVHTRLTYYRTAKLCNGRLDEHLTLTMIRWCPDIAARAALTLGGHHGDGAGDLIDDDVLSDVGDCAEGEEPNTRSNKLWCSGPLEHGPPEPAVPPLQRALSASPAVWHLCQRSRDFSRLWVFRKHQKLFLRSK